MDPNVQQIKNAVLDKNYETLKAIVDSGIPTTQQFPPFQASFPEYIVWFFNPYDFDDNDEETMEFFTRAITLTKDGINLQDVRGDTALHIAAEREMEAPTIFFLKEDGTDPTIKNNEGNTFLHNVVYSGNDEFVDDVLSHLGEGVNREALILSKNNYGNTAIDIAYEENYPYIVDVLKAYLPADGVAGEDGDHQMEGADWIEPPLGHDPEEYKNMRVPINITKTVHFSDPITLEESDITISQYMSSDPRNVVIMYQKSDVAGENDYFFTTRDVIDIQINNPSNIFYGCKEPTEALYITNAFVSSQTRRYFNLSSIGFVYSTGYCDISLLLDNPDQQLFALYKLQRSFPAYVSKDTLQGGNVVSGLHCQEGHAAKTNVLVLGASSLLDNKQSLIEQQHNPLHILADAAAAQPQAGGKKKTRRRKKSKAKRKTTRSKKKSKQRKSRRLNIAKRKRDTRRK